MNDRVRIFTLLITGSAFASCGGDPNPTALGPGSGDGDPPMTRVILQNPSFEQDVQEIFVRTMCADSGCHRDGQAGLFLRPNDAANYGNIVNVAAENEREYFLVEPFDATNSYMIIRLEDRQRVGVPMPPGSRIDNIDLTNLRNWIDNGAPNN